MYKVGNDRELRLIKDCLIVEANVIYCNRFITIGIESTIKYPGLQLNKSTSCKSNHVAYYLKPYNSGLVVSGVETSISNTRETNTVNYISAATQLVFFSQSYQ